MEMSFNIVVNLGKLNVISILHRIRKKKVFKINFFFFFFFVLKKNLKMCSNQSFVGDLVVLDYHNSYILGCTQLCFVVIISNR